MLKKIIKAILVSFDIGVHRYSVKKRNEEKWIKDISFKTVIDVGANMGQYAGSIRTLLPNAMIYSFEPLPECFDALTDAFKSDKQFKAFNCGLGDTNGEIEMFKNDFSASSSILPMAELHKINYPFTKETSPIKIKIGRLDSLDLEIQSPLLIKIDVQGFEDKVIEGGLITLMKATALIIELSVQELYEGQPLFHEIYTKIHNLGFKFMGISDQTFDEVDGKVLQVDAIFIKG